MAWKRLGLSFRIARGSDRAPGPSSSLQTGWQLTPKRAPNRGEDYSIPELKPPESGDRVTFPDPRAAPVRYS
jgi:hypothetical protein